MPNTAPNWLYVFLNVSGELSFYLCKAGYLGLHLYLWELTGRIKSPFFWCFHSTPSFTSSVKHEFKPYAQSHLRYLPWRYRVYFEVTQNVLLTVNVSWHMNTVWLCLVPNQVLGQIIFYFRYIFFLTDDMHLSKWM